MRPFLASAVLGIGLAAARPGFAQGLGPFDVGFGSLPTFSWWDPDPGRDGTRWEGAYARASTGFEVSSSKHFGTSAGPTVGFEGGRMWRDGDLVYGIAGAFDYLAPFGSFSTPGFGRIGYSRDFAGAVQFKVGTPVADNVLLYTKLGLGAVNQTFRFGPTSASLPFSRDDIAVGPDARVGVEWAVDDRTTLSLEVGVARPTVR